MKLKLAKIFNYGDENFFKIKAVRKNTAFTITEIQKFLSAFNFEKVFFHNYGMDDAPAIKKSYADEIGFHKFISNDKYKLHLICEVDYVYLIIKCDCSDRPFLIDLMFKHFDFLKSKSLAEKKFKKG